jgi:hypothetical protein
LNIGGIGQAETCTLCTEVISDADVLDIDKDASTACEKSPFKILSFERTDDLSTESIVNSDLLSKGLDSTVDNIIDPNALRKYAVGTFYRLGSVTLSTKDIRGTNSAPEAITFSITTASTGLNPVEIDFKFLVDPNSGYVQGIAHNRGNLTISLFAIDTEGATAVVENFVFRAEFRDTTTDINGPGGKGCFNGGIAIDLIEFDSDFDCECLSNYHGSNCERSTITGEGWAGIIGGIVLSVGVLLGTLRYNEYKRQHKRIDFQTDFEKFALAVNSPSTLDSTVTPREIRRGCLDFVRKIGSGAFGEVWMATIDEKQVPEYHVAVKTVLNQDSEGAQDLLTEAFVMAHVGSHLNLVSMIGVVTTGSPYLLVLSYCDNGSLLSFISKRAADGTPISATQKLSFAWQSSAGVGHLISKEFIHRDLAARNVLVASGKATGGLVCKVADFGLSRVGEDGRDGDQYYRSQRGVFPVRWTAPEAIETLVFNEKTDVWSFGILLFELVSDGDKPYLDLKSNADVLKFVLTGGHPTEPAGCSSNMFEIMRSCWEADPAKRPPFSALVREFNRMHDEAVMITDDNGGDGHDDFSYLQVGHTDSDNVPAILESKGTAFYEYADGVVGGAHPPTTTEGLVGGYVLAAPTNLAFELEEQDSLWL